MYKVSGELLQEITTNLNQLVVNLWLNSELTPEQFNELSVVKETNRLVEILNLNYQTV